MNNKIYVYKAYILLESGASGGTSFSEIWENYKFEGDQAFRKVLRVKMNGADIAIPAEAQEKWFPVNKLQKDNKSDYNGLDEIFFAGSRNSVTYKKTGKSKIIYGRTCTEYTFRMKRNSEGKSETLTDKAYFDFATVSTL